MPNSQAGEGSTKREEVSIAEATGVVRGMELAAHKSLLDEQLLHANLDLVNDTVRFTVFDIRKDKNNRFELPHLALFGFEG